MRNAFVVFILLFSFIDAAQENQTTDPCAGISCTTPPAAFCKDDKTYVKYASAGTCDAGICKYSEESFTCPQSTTTCPDGFVASCQQTCDAATGCRACTPSCAGHEAPLNFTPPCPLVPPPLCPAGTYLKTNYDANGCALYECVPSSNFTGVCGNDVCESGEDSVNCASDCFGAICGNNICEEHLGESYFNCGQDCPNPSCPAYTPPLCEQGYLVSGLLNESGCKEPPTCCGDGICSGAENSQNCYTDCIGGAPDKMQCPDGRFVSCRMEEGKRICNPCPVQIPPGCRQEVDNQTGFVRVFCENVQRICPAFSIPQDAKQRCEQSGGRFEIRKDFNGCEFPDCVFGDVSVRLVPVLNPLEPGKKCPVETEEQREATKRSCESLGLHFVISVHGECKVSKCSAKAPKRGCEPLPLEERRRIEGECRERRLDVVKDFDDIGCPMMRCGERTQCRQELPEQSYEKCAEHGGELVIRRNEQGCIVFSQCIVQGDISEVDVDPIEKIPESTELLSMAFRLEELRIELDKLARKTDDIADYYASVNSPEEGRYRRVADMFEAAMSKVDEIKEKLRNAVESGIEHDDLIEIKRDIKYIKDVMMKDILYLMLSSSEDVKEIKESRAVKRGERFEEVPATDETNCGSGDECFDRAFRLCKKVIFYPEGRQGPRVEVRGLEGDACIMYAVLPEGEGPPPGLVPGVNPPYDMTCKIQKYALGIRTPEEDVFPYCEGPMVELMKKFGSRGEGAPGVPGKCRAEECREYCGRGPEEAKECLEHLGPYLPPEAREGLERMASGEFERFGQFEGGRFPPPPGEFRGEFEHEGEFRGEFPPPGEFEGEQCSGCLANNICDPAECSFCPDCRR